MTIKLKVGWVDRALVTTRGWTFLWLTLIDIEKINNDETGDF